MSALGQKRISRPEIATSAVSPKTESSEAALSPGQRRLPILFQLPPILPAMDARTPATHIPGYSRARLKRMIAAGNVAAFAIGFWTIFFPTQLYAVGLSLCVLLPLWGLALEMSTRGALGFESRRGRRYPLSIATIIPVPALALAARAISDLNFENYSLLIAAAVLTALTIFALFWSFDPQLRSDLNQVATIAIFALAYCYGALAFADVILDVSSGQDTQTVIHEKRIHVSGGPKGSRVERREACPAAYAAKGHSSDPHCFGAQINKLIFDLRAPMLVKQPFGTATRSPPRPYRRRTSREARHAIGANERNNTISRANTPAIDYVGCGTVYPSVSKATGTEQQQVWCCEPARPPANSPIPVRTLLCSG
jgi:hypothetical protein